MHTLFKTLTGVAVAAALGAALIAWTPQVASAQTPAATAQPAAAPEKKAKDQTEYDLINNVIKDLAGTDAQKTLADLNTWNQKYPESDFKDDRLAYYQQAYGATNPPQNDKVVDYGGQLLAKDLKSVFKEQAMILQVLFRTSAAVQALQNPTAEQLATGDKAAKQLLAFLPSYFDPKNKPANASDADWAKARGQLEAVANGAISFVILYPGQSAEAKGDLPGAEAAYRKALLANPNMGLLAYKLGSVIVKEKDVVKYPTALYYIARADAMDPANGGLDATTRTTVDGYLNRAYVGFHGSDEGLAELKALAVKSPEPPADFKIKNTSEIAAEKQKQFQEKYPEVALWMGIKGLLAGTDGDKSFEDMKGTEVKGLKGIVMSGEPECNPKKVVIAVPDPEAKSTPTPEITLKLEATVKGKPVQGQEVKFDGVPSAFAKDPFMLTLDIDKDSMPEFKVDTCTPAKTAPKTAPKKPAPGGAVKKAPPKK